jgi:putative cell wall-binding protein/glycerophosphoryl diester phosphodiesterase
MSRRLVLLLAPLLLVLPLAPAAAQEDGNPWMDRRDLTIGHRGALFDGPENTLYSMHQAVAAGVHMFEFDLHSSAEGEIVVIHDDTVDRTTDAEGHVGSMTVEELKALDAGYWHIPATYPHRRDGAPDEYVYRGIATGEVPPPEGFTANDFTIPTLEEVLEAFPDTWLLFEIKDFQSTQAPPSAPPQRLAELLEAYDRDSSNGIVASFDDRWLEVMQQLSPQMSFAPGLAQAAAMWTLIGQGGVPEDADRYDILFLPESLGPIEPVDADTVANANAAGLAVHVFTVNDCHELEAILDTGVHGVLSDGPRLLEALYRWRGARGGDRGIDPCAIDAVDRVAGADRVETAARISQDVFRAAGTDTIVLARADDYADALAGAPLAAQEGAPVLLTPRDALSDWVRVEIERLAAGRVVILGGETAVSPGVADELAALGVEVERIGGANRFATAAEVAAQLDEWDTALVVEGAHTDPGRGWPDAVSAGSYAGLTGSPVLLVTRDRLPEETATALEGASEVVVVGGAAAVSPAVEEQLAEDAEVRRIAGRDRYDTSRLIVEAAQAEADASRSILWLATGADWPDALAVGPAAAATGAPLLLVGPGDLDRSAPSRAVIEAQREDLRDVRAAGGAAAIAQRVLDQVVAILAREAP